MDTKFIQFVGRGKRPSGSQMTFEPIKSPILGTVAARLTHEPARPKLTRNQRRINAQYERKRRRNDLAGVYDKYRTER